MLFRERRGRLLESLGPRAVMVLPTAPVHIRNNDVEHDFRPDSDVFYLTGFAEPETVLVLSSARDGEESRFVLFVRPRDPDREVWDGPRAGIEGARMLFGADVAYPMSELEAKLPELLVGSEKLYYALGRDRRTDDTVIASIARARGRCRKGGIWPTNVVDPATVVHEMRWKKDEAELGVMRRGAEITRDGFHRALSVMKPGAYEHEVEGALRGTFRTLGSERTAYSPIVASGANACVLHYVLNNRRMEDGDLLLIDAGAEFGGYACDVTRTFPVGGRYTPPQRLVYDAVLAAQKAAIEATRPGATIEQVHLAAAEVITKALVELGILHGDPSAIVEAQGYKKYFMHGTSHWLGMDVHDVGRYYMDRIPRGFEPGCVITVEPGIYIAPSDESVPPEFRGIGVRIEDDVAVTANGAMVLTHDIPKEPAEVEALLASLHG